jgi:hypothetical protein
MTKIIQTVDRSLALRCKRACLEEKEITVNYETRGGWNRASGMVQSVRRLKVSPLKPCWEIIFEEPAIIGGGLPENERMPTGQAAAGAVIEENGGADVPVTCVG